MLSVETNILIGKSHVYLIGIGGIGMSALALYFKKMGMEVSGYDLVNSSVVQKIKQYDINIIFNDSIESLLPSYKNPLEKEKILVIYTPAIKEDNHLLHFFRINNYIVKKRAEVIGYLSKEKKTLAVAGTHGKTTTTSILAHIFKTANCDALSFAGGIVKNYNSNIIIPEKGYEYMIIEADEYDRSFLQLSPSYSIITSIDYDHSDIYASVTDLQNAFVQFINKSERVLIHELAASLIKDQISGTYNTYSFSSDNGASYYITNCNIVDGHYRFNVKGREIILKELEFHLPGKYNLENALAATILALHNGISEIDIREALKTYKGVKRRFDIQYKSKKLTYIDDYAHHPKEIQSFIGAVNEMYPEKKITVIFQPHLYSRTKDFLNEFSQVLSTADHVILMDIYPAREKPIKGVSSQVLLDKITTSSKQILGVEQILRYVEKASDIEILATIGAGDIDLLIDPLKEIIARKCGD